MLRRNNLLVVQAAFSTIGKNGISMSENEKVVLLKSDLLVVLLSSLGSQQTTTTKPTKTNDDRRQSQLRIDAMAALWSLAMGSEKTADAIVGLDGVNTLLKLLSSMNNATATTTANDDDVDVEKNAEKNVKNDLKIVQWTLGLVSVLAKTSSSSHNVVGLIVEQQQTGISIISTAMKLYAGKEKEICRWGALLLFTLSQCVEKESEMTRESRREARRQLRERGMIELLEGMIKIYELSKEKEVSLWKTVSCALALLSVET